MRKINPTLFAQGAVMALSCMITQAIAQNTDGAGRPPPEPNPLLQQADQTTLDPGVSPARRINRQPPPLPAAPSSEGRFRSIDGSGNHVTDLTRGAAHILLSRWMPAVYADGTQALTGQNRLSPRAISNRVSAQPASLPNTRGASDFLWQWGQFLDHDIDLTDGANPPESANISVPAGDPYFDPDGTGTMTIAFNRSLYDPASGISADSPRQQINEITAWIDASNVYGSDQERALALRANDGTGRLRVSDGALLPFNTEGLANAGGSSATLFLAGDVRANEQVGLTALHTLFVREHNRLADEIRAANPDLDGEEIYQQARRRVGAQMQVITYREYLPTLLGPDALAPYTGYRPEVNANIANIFATAAYRYGHSALSPTLLRLDAQGNAIPAGHLALRDAFFAPQRLTDEGGIEPILRGLAHQVCESIDPYVIDDVRNFLFGPPGAGGFDLAALNIQRGRDHGLPDYNAVRIAFNLAPRRRFAEINADPEIQTRLTAAYTSVDDIDVWVGGLAEPPQPGAMVGELIFTVLKAQFEALRDGDRYWYRRTLTPEGIEQVENTRLADIIRRNTAIGQEIPNDVFRVPANPPPSGGPGR